MGIETLAIAGVAASLIGTGVSAYGAYEQGQVAKSTAEQNAKLAEQQAATLDQENRENMRRMAVENKRVMAKQRAGYAASGVRIDTGSPLEAQAETAAILEMDMLDQNRASQAQQSSLFSQAQSSRMAGRNYATAGTIGAAGSLFGGLGSIGYQSYQYRRAGVFN